MAATLLLSVRDAEVRFGPKLLFQELTFNIVEGDRISLVGKNGTGKSTLMQLIEGVREPDDGERWSFPGTTVGHLPQETRFVPGQTVRDYIFERLKDNEDGAQDYKVELIIEPLLLDPTAKMESLSGGQLRRAALGRVLAEEPDILLLDEPTNHLDLEIIEWLEGFLLGWRGALVVVSHDRRFLANVSAKIFWLDRGKLKICQKGFGHFDEWSTELLLQEERELRNRSKVIEYEVEWASRGVQGRRKRNVRRLEQMKTERDRLRSDKHHLARMLQKVEFATPGESVSHSKIVAEFHKVDKAYDSEDGRRKTILQNFNLRLLRGDRIGIVGRNGSGKTSFLKLLVGEMEADSGRVKLARELAVSYLDQKKELPPEKTLREILAPQGGDHIEINGPKGPHMRHIASYLKDFLFDPRMADQPVGTLSGGQRNRLMLAKTMAKPGGLLVLDEPTNDLDMDTLERLEDMIAAYQGTLIIVSHDRDFLDQTVTSILAFEGDGLVEGHIGGWEDYEAAKRQQAKNAARAAEKTAVPIIAPVAANDTAPELIAAKPLKLTNKQKYEREALPRRIRELETELIELETALTDASLYMREPEAFDAKSRRITAARAELEQAEVRWLELEDLAGVTAQNA